MNDIWLQVALVLVLIIFNALFAGSEIALVSLREGQIRRLAEGSKRQQTLARLARDPNQFLSTIQIGITLGGFLASATAAVALAQPLIGPLEPVFGIYVRPVAIVLVTLALTYVTLVFGELAPKRLALQRAEGWGAFASPTLVLLAKITKPVVWLLGKSTDFTVRLLGGNPSARREEIGEEELRDMVTTGTAFSHLQREILSGAFEIKERRLREVAVPRPEIFSLPADTEIDKALRTLLGSGHSRAPVIGRNIDDVVGIIHLRDLVGAAGKLLDHTREAYSLPEALPVMNALREMQRNRQQMTMVIDEHGGVEGLVTIEDLLEELVGEIYDEFDQDVSGVEHLEDGSLVAPGRFPVHDLEDIGVELPRGEYTTLAGVMLERLGRVPKASEAVESEGYRLEALEVANNAILRIKISRVRDAHKNH
ncbi:MAG: hemolysin family protein [Actinomycetota bacterium]|nr:hemolysin family protein [Actinomycetota bacterium]